MINRIKWTPQLVNKFWDGVAQTELDSLSFGKLAGPQFLELIKNYLVPGRSYLDFGAGSGHVLQLLLDQGLDAAGFDPSPDRQALLLEKIGQHKNFLGVKGSESDEQFDVVLFMEVIEHVLDEDFATVLDRVSSFVKPGGYLIVSTPNNENLETASVYCPVSDTFFHPWQHVRSFIPRQLADCFAERGFAKDFLALADFSSDAEIIETCKRSAAVQEKHLNERLTVALRKYQVSLAKLGHADDELKSRLSLNFGQKLKLRWSVFKNHRALIAQLHSVAHEMAHIFDELAIVLNEHNRKAALIGGLSSDKDFQCEDEIDVRIGREATIVFVGKKNVV